MKIMSRSRAISPIRRFTGNCTIRSDRGCRQHL